MICHEIFFEPRCALCTVGFYAYTGYTAVGSGLSGLYGVSGFARDPTSLVRDNIDEVPFQNETFAHPPLF